MLDLGSFLRLIRTRHNLTQSEMGDIFLRNKDYVYMIENNKVVPKIEELELISKKLDEPVVMLVMYGLCIKDIIKRWENGR